MIPKETKCKYCGRPVLFVPGPRGLLCVEASLTPYRFRRAAESSDGMVTLYTNSGTPLAWHTAAIAATSAVLPR